ncbi:MAG: type I-MYXAN CRISPR-associated protein Cas6/Cmx6, partial [Pseudomonadota bacterium]
LISDPAESETRFLSKAADQLDEMGIRVTKMMCGKSSSFMRDGNPVFTRSLMLAGLKPEESIRLQQRGFDGAQQFGCGLFVPHKGVRAVVDIQE